MEYLVLARKWRPQVFDDVVGQEHVVTTLRNAIRLGRVAHAYLFTGRPRRRQDVGRPHPGQGAQLRERAHADAVQRVRRSAASITRGQRRRRAGDRRRQQPRHRRDPPAAAERRRAARAGRASRSTSSTKSTCSPSEAFNALLKTLEEPPRAREVHLRHHRAAQDPDHDPLALPAIRLQAHLAEGDHGHPAQDRRRGRHQDKRPGTHLDRPGRRGKPPGLPEHLRSGHLLCRHRYQ